MATTIINATMATAIINAAIFLKKFFIFSSLSLFNTAVFFNCKNFVSNLTCHFPTKTKNPAARITSKRQDFLTKKGISTANPSYVLRKFFFPLLLYTVYQIFRCTQIFVGFFCRQQKKRLTALFSNTETFFFCVFSYVLQCICLGINHLSSIHLWH